MAKEAMFTLKLEPELRDAFMTEAAEADRPASQLVRDFVRQRRQAREHDAWFRAEVEQGMREADDPAVQRIPHEDVASDRKQQRAELVKPTGRQPGREASGRPHNGRRFG